MKNTIIGLILLLFITQTMAQKNNPEQWKKVDSLQNTGQYRTTLDMVMDIYKKSKADNLPDQQVRALLYKIKLESAFEEKSYENTISFIEEELVNAQSPVKQILCSIIGQVYWNYYTVNMWKIDERTRLDGNPSEDISTWDASRFVEVCSEYYIRSVSEAEVLKKTDLSQFGAILEGEKDSWKLRPTLYDFLVFRAIDFFTGEKVGVSMPANAFILNDSKYFYPAPEFVRLNISASDKQSFEFQALKLYQEVLRFHLSEQPGASEALVDADLARLEFIYMKNTLPDKEKYYEEALQHLANKYKNQIVSAEINYQLASHLKIQGDKYNPLVNENHKQEIIEAVEIAEKTVRQFPETHGGRNCMNLLSLIKAPSLQSTGNYAVIPDQPSLMLVEYKNVNTLFFRLLKVDPKEIKDDESFDYTNVPKKYLSQNALHRWSQKMPSDGDFQTHSAEVRIPAVGPGFYVLLASVTSGFKADSLISWSKFWSTGISLVNHLNNNGQNELLVLGRKDGQPLPGVKMQPFYRKWNYNLRKSEVVEGLTMTTDANGYLLLKQGGEEQNGRFYLVLSTSTDKFITESYFSDYRNENEPTSQIRTHFFTDRAIYRPGQIIYYKGIVTEQTGNRPKIKTGFKTKVKFYDVNMQEIAVQEVETNEFGSFSGSFVAPQGSLTGSMTIFNDFGHKSVRIEEYKRPKFEVVFNHVKGSFKLGQEVTLSGKAASYSGNSIPDGKVTYRVVRNARFPWIHWNWEGKFPSSPEMEITSGKTSTDNNGEFTLKFNAIPDPSVAEEHLPLFTYTVYADVTDINGETHSAETKISAGLKALIVSTDIPDNVNGADGIKFEVSTTNLNGQPEKASGSISIHRIIQPSAVLFPRKWKRPDKFTLSRDEFKKLFPGEVYDKEDDITGWPKGDPVYSGTFSTPSVSVISAASNLPPGLYLIEINTKDVYGTDVVYNKYFNVFQPVAGKVSSISPFVVTLLKPKAEPGESAGLLIASPLSNVHVVLEITSLNSEVKRTFHKINNQQLRIDIPVEESQRGNIAINVTFIKNNRVFQENKLIEVPYTNKELDITAGSFRSKLEPGQQEEWQITIRDKQGQKAVAEMAATLYDASLDAFMQQDWDFSLYHHLVNTWPRWNSNTSFHLARGNSTWYPHIPFNVNREYVRMIDFMPHFYGSPIMQKSEMMIRGARNAANPETMAPASEVIVNAQREEDLSDEITSKQGKQPPVSQSLPPAKPRSDFNETAFFFPQLATNEKGELLLKFKMPESLTRWRFMGLAHTVDLKTGMIEKSVITQKDLMVFPNAPRFLRVGDKIQFTVKISNISENELSGKAELHFFDAFTMKPVDERMNLSPEIKNFVAGKGGSTVINWEIVVPEALQAVVYRVTATSGSLSDGEEAPLPILPNRMLVTESMPLPVRANSSKSFRFDVLLKSKTEGSTLKNYKLTLEYTSNPAWYAVQALPYLAEFPYECAEQLFSRYYANTLAGHIANSDPKIRQVFDAWRNFSPEALKSNLEKNEDLKNILLQESPWVREASGESERKQKMAVLFDLNRMESEQKTALKKLSEMQSENGGWPWFPGMPENEYITRHIVAGIGHLYHLKAISRDDNGEVYAILGKAIDFLDAEKLKSFEEMKKRDPDYLKNNHLGYDDIHYFYARTFLTNDFPFGEKLAGMVNYFKTQMSRYWLKNNNYMKAMTALSLFRLEDRNTAVMILRSLSETALHNEEQGMYWKGDPRGWFWYQAPIETQAMMIEAFDEISADTKAVDELKVWLLKQKQTQDWKTTRATTEAIYALILRGTSLLATGNQAKITVGGTQVNPYLSEGVKPEPGTGYFKTSWEAPAIKPEMGNIRVENSNAGIAWGALHWQYFEQLDKITPAETPLKLSKNLFVEENSANGPVLKAITMDQPVRVGDKVVVRVTLTTDRDMEYIHLKDMRAAAFEPVNVLSGYRWQGGLGYYESTRDAATNFFIDYLPKGTWVFEYRLFATQKGEFSNGITSVQCMYAPEFTAHSEGFRIKVNQ